MTSIANQLAEKRQERTELSGGLNALTQKYGADHAITIQQSQLLVQTQQEIEKLEAMVAA
jgi:hypothetical protein